MPPLKSLAMSMITILAIAGPASADFDMKAGQIFNDHDAQNKCPRACDLTWNGHWVTITEGKMSICSATNGFGHVIMESKGGVEAGPIWNNGDAPAKCERALGQAKWNGHWKHIAGRAPEAVCGCTGKAQPWK